MTETLRQYIVAGNWKMHGSTEFARQYVTQFSVPASVSGVLFPPFPYLATLADLLQGSDIACGSQDVHAETKGAFTGDVAADMVAELGGQWTLVGHSERREYHGETDSMVARKAAAADAAGLRVIVCVGEALAERKAGRALATVGAQIRAVAEELDADLLSRLAWAYEPIWAIGTGETATPEQAEEMHAALRGVLTEVGHVDAHAATILYGGSVNAENAASLFAAPNIDGALVGGASLQADQLSVIGDKLAAAKR